MLVGVDPASVFSSTVANAVGVGRGRVGKAHIPIIMVLAKGGRSCGRGGRRRRGDRDRNLRA